MRLDVEFLEEYAFKRGEEVKDLKKRFFVNRLASFTEPRIKVIKGFRGTGKTTALLQIFRENPRSMYLSVDNPYILRFSLYEWGRELHKRGYRILLFDEIHRYPNWKEEIKALYDEFPDLSFVISGSSPLAFQPDRRFEVISVVPLSLKEFMYLNGKKIKVEEEDWKNWKKTLKFIASHPFIEEEFFKYVEEGGALPMFFRYKEKTLKGIYNSILKSIREDSTFFEKIDGSMVIGMERILSFLTESKPGALSINTLTQLSMLSKHKTYEILSLLERMEIIRMVKPYTPGPAKTRKEPKILFTHPVLRLAMAKGGNLEEDKGAIREELTAFAFSTLGYSVFYLPSLKKAPDFFIKKKGESFIVEVGGQAKSRVQLGKYRNETTYLLKEKQLIPLLCLF